MAVLSKPSEGDLRNALQKSYGLVYDASELGERLGLLTFTYNDYFVYSTLSARLPTQPDTVVAYGYFGNSYAPTPKIDLGAPRGRTSERSPDPVVTTAPAQTPYQAPVQPEANVALPPPSGLSEDEIRRNLRQIYPVMEAEMLAEAINAARQKHPASKFIGEGCAKISFTTQTYQEIRWTYHGLYRCQMRGAILGITHRDFNVQVDSQVEIRNSVFVRGPTRSLIQN